MGTPPGFLPYLKQVLFIKVSIIKTSVLEIKLKTSEIDFKFKIKFKLKLKLKLKFVKLFVESLFTFLLWELLFASGNSDLGCHVVHVRRS